MNKRRFFKKKKKILFRSNVDSIILGFFLNIIIYMTKVIQQSLNEFDQSFIGVFISHMCKIRNELSFNCFGMTNNSSRKFASKTRHIVQ